MVADLSNAGILQRILASADEQLTPEVARYFLGLSIADPDMKRIEELSEKANEGDLTPAERDDLASYILLNDLLAIMKSSARHIINPISSES